MNNGYIDLLEKARTDPEFLGKVYDLIDKIEDAEIQGNSRTVKAGMTDLLRLCDYNCGFLLPFCYPTFRDSQPLSLSRRPFAFSFYQIRPRGYTVYRGSRQISKSTNMQVRTQMLTRMLFDWKVQYVAPHQEHSKTYANGYQDVEAGFRYRQININKSRVRDNLYYKQIAATRSTVTISSALTTAAHLRGKRADQVDYDEYQLFDRDLEYEINQQLRTAPMPLITYAGTSTTTDSPLEIRFQESSQGTWQIKSPDNVHFIDCGDKDQVLKIVTPRGLICPHTNKPLDPMNGFFEHRNSAAIGLNRIGFHIPQFIVPDFLNPQDWFDKIWTYLVDFGENQFLQEVCGIPVEEGTREVTLDELRDICDLPDDKFGSYDLRVKQARSGKYRFVLSGMDWGGSDHQIAAQAKTSYTVHAIGGVKHNGGIDLLHFKRYSGMRYQDIAEQILAEHTKFGCFAAVSDYGAGAFYNTFIHDYLPPNRHFLFQYGMPYAPILTVPKQAYLPGHFLLNKTESLSQTFHAVREKKMHCFNWQHSKVYLMDFMNSMRIPSERQFGQQFFRYIRKPTLPDDTMHAVNFLHVLARMLLGEALFDDRSINTRILRDLNLSGTVAQAGSRRSGDSLIVTG